MVDTLVDSRKVSGSFLPAGENITKPNILYNAFAKIERLQR